MIFATLKDGSRDGLLAAVSSDYKHYVTLPHIKSLQMLLDHWDSAATHLTSAASQLNHNDTQHLILPPVSQFHSPLPRAYEWIDGSAFLHHVRLVRKARNAEPPPTLESDPLIYQGGSGVLLGPTDDIPLADPQWGLDFESEVCVVLGDTPQGTKANEAHKFIRLVMIANDVSLRNLIPQELAKGFGFFGSKPATAFSPFAVTPDELGESWRDGRLHMNICTQYNQTFFGNPSAGSEMHFGFFELIEHICKTRSFTAGTILGSGTVSNEDPKRGSSCLAERRMIETIATGAPTTPFMKVGDTIEIYAESSTGTRPFGTINQRVVSV